MSDWDDLEPWEQLAAKLADAGPTEERAREWVLEVMAAARADERDKVGEMGIRAARKGAAIAVLEWKADLRARIQALPERGLEIPHDDDTGKGHDMLWRDDVLALLDGGSDG